MKATIWKSYLRIIHVYLNLGCCIKILDGNTNVQEKKSVHLLAVDTFLIYNLLETHLQNTFPDAHQKRHVTD